jgi:LPXTG-motif cell wall-anchored protein
VKAPPIKVLPHTGSSTAPLAFLGSALVALGLALAGRRRRTVS